MQDTPALSPLPPVAITSPLSEAAAHTAPLARVIDLGPALQAAADRIENAREIPPDIIAALHEARLFRLLLPKSLNGYELDLCAYAHVMEQLASYDASTAWSLGQNSGCSMSAAYLHPEAAQRLFGAADAVLAWGAGIQGKARRVDGGYLVTGKWAFSSGSRHATLLGGHSYLFAEDGTTPLVAPDGRHRDRTMIFNRDKATIHDTWHVMGLRGTGSDTFEVTELFVPEDETCDRDKPDERYETGTLYRCSTSLAYGVGFAALQVGIASAMLDDLRTLAMKKTPRGAASSLRDSAQFHTALAQLIARHRAARAYLHTSAATIDSLAKLGELAIPDRANLKLATTHVITECVTLTTEAFRAAGATAIFPTQPFERRLRDALTGGQQVQGRVQNYTTTGRCLLGLAPDTTMFL